MTDDEVIDWLWAEMPIAQVRIIQEENPEVVERAQLAHERVWHSGEIEEEEDGPEEA
jgi:hypothetical protein